MFKLYSAAMALAIGRFTGSILHQVRSPGGSLDELVQLGSSAVQLAAALVRARRGFAGPSWVLILALVSAEGATGALPMEVGAHFIGELAEGVAFLGGSLITMIVVLVAIQKWLPRLRMGLPPPQPAPFLTPCEPHSPGGRSWTKRRSVAAR